MTKVRISDDALADLNDGHWFYETQEPGLGDYFESCLRADIEALKVSAGIGIASSRSIKTKYNTP
jgi:hypothetical protein